MHNIMLSEKNIDLTEKKCKGGLQTEVGRVCLNILSLTPVALFRPER